MQIEQAAELNKHVDSSLPLTWAVRWQTMKLVLPLLVCCSGILLEGAIFRLWLSDRSLISVLPILFICALAPIAAVMVAVEIRVRVSHRIKRTIKLEPKRVSISPAEYNRVTWDQIVSWRLQPLAQAPGLSKLTMGYSFGKKSRRETRWSMVLRQPDQEQIFLSELEYYRQAGSNVAPLIRLTEPCLPKPPGRHLRRMVALALAFWCFVHGLPLLGVGLLPPGRYHDESKSASEFTPNETAKLNRTATRYFSSIHQFRTFLLVVGGGVTALGVGLYLWALSSPKKSGEPEVRSEPGV
jgi:hypothetical protein